MDLIHRLNLALAFNNTFYFVEWLMWGSLGIKLESEWYLIHSLYFKNVPCNFV